MNSIKTILCITILLAPTISLGHDSQNSYHSGYSNWQRQDRQERYRDDSYRDDSYGYERDYQRGNSHKKKPNRKKQPVKRQVQSGWDISPQIAKGASNCYQYSLSARGGKGSARIMSIPGKNYIQVNGTKSGYVCFQGEPTLELGKLGDPNVKVTFQLEGKGTYGFQRGQTGSSYINQWYRSYWNL